MHLFLLGGGELGRGETFELDRFLVEATGKRSPKVVFIPAASEDPPSYGAVFKELYQGEFGAQVEVLNLVRERPVRQVVEAFVRDADLIFFGGGSTPKLLAALEAYDLAPTLRSVATQGTLVAGISAGAIMWARLANTSWQHPSWHGITPPDCIPGLGDLPLIVAPHLGGQPHRLPGLLQAVESPLSQGLPGLGIEDQAMVEVKGEKCRVHVQAPGEGAVFFRLDPETRAVESRWLRPQDGWMPVPWGDSGS